MLEVLGAHRDVWAAPTVIGYLHRLIRAAGLDAARGSGSAAAAPGKGKRTASQAAEAAAPSALHYQLGYFSVVGLSRLECLIGDYDASLEAHDVPSQRRPRSRSWEAT